MAILWEKRSAQGLYQVRTAGKTVRLYKGGVFHSHYNPRQIVTRGVWDLLVLPALLHPEHSIRRVLLLGVGGGAAIHLLNHFVKPQSICAIELDATHLYIAKRFFKTDYRNTELIHGDAIAWVKRQAKRKHPPQFDLIIDDLYGEEEGEPVRAIAADADWCARLNTLLAENGLLVANFVEASELRQSAYLKHRKTRRQFKQGYRFSNPNYQNQIAAFSRRPCSRKAFIERMQEYRSLRSRSYRETFALRKLM